jgi:hypothetical protein
VTCSTSPRDRLSPSGKYRLVVTSYTTGTLGVITRVADGEEIARVDRNYHSFEHTWIEDHPSGHDYLVCGEDYQGQTVIELDTGARGDGAQRSRGESCTRPCASVRQQHCRRAPPSYREW